MKLSYIGSNFYLFFLTTKVIVPQNLGPIVAELNLITSEKENTYIHKKDNYLRILLKRYRLKIKLAWTLSRLVEAKYLNSWMVYLSALCKGSKYCTIYMGFALCGMVH